jgi:hypothetical protein
MKIIKYIIFISSSGSRTVISYSSGSDFITSYGSGSTSKKVTVPNGSYGSDSGSGSTKLHSTDNWSYRFGDETAIELKNIYDVSPSEIRMSISHLTNISKY